ncbi:hypothetical protein POSPLADRAFT_1038358 [Postia placenta MAD-698-R-SB12]|uniref:Uncharacterized protein n=1 Tax=Postia placenta MAD-698-R-SB12 TaxID=670580 RepID=A0A1X6NBH7_9APHY|nr:hypothetical protein POSPLADRAFT_1038358 [Postia placenta MAD-698-R-SB12]OSX65733.1 hypothetical protein POSPLADRAFT_1038358 [Postia placenta MAD-698-R-SB12]
MSQNDIPQSSSPLTSRLMLLFSPKPSKFSLVTLSSVLFALSLAIKLVVTVYLKSLALDDAHKYSTDVLPHLAELTQCSLECTAYLGADHPPRWPITVPRVLMASDASTHFQLTTAAGIAEWVALVPGNGLVHLGPHRAPYTVAMLHELRCLDIVRDAMVHGLRSGNMTDAQVDLGRHCLNYLRQMVLCRGDLQLEPFLAPSHYKPIDLYGTYVCRDWGAVYREVEQNQREYAR